MHVILGGGVDMATHRSPFSARAILLLVLAGILTFAVAGGLAACGQSSNTASSGSKTNTGTYTPNKALDTSSPVHLVIVGNSATNKSLENTINSFCQIYPNCNIDYEYIQDYDKNMPTRLASNDNIDLFMTKNIQAGSSCYPYALELLGQSDKLDLSGAYQGLIRNFTVTSDGVTKLYAVPLGGEIRGMYVNTTLLDSLGLKVPTNYKEFMECCKALKAAGYVPLQGNPSTFGQHLMYPYVCNLVANANDYQTAYNKVENREAQTSTLFTEPVSRLYEIVQNGYYDYKFVETKYSAFSDSTEAVAVRSFLGITADANGSYAKADDIGKVAFMPQAMSFKNALDKASSDYHSGIKYQFILSPVGDDGGFAYLSPATGMAVNANSSNTAWALEFMNYLFSPDINKKFSSDAGYVPNTADALESIHTSFDVAPSHISQLGQVSFSYVFYDVMNKTLTDVSKANNPKYMQSDGTMYPLSYYMDNLEAAFIAARG
jgi:ABC-type glycerol-3-phosphate transport system substrate-binding protein